MCKIGLVLSHILCALCLEKDTDQFYDKESMWEIYIPGL